MTVTLVKERKVVYGLWVAKGLEHTRGTSMPLIKEIARIIAWIRRIVITMAMAVSNLNSRLCNFDLLLASALTSLENR